MTGRAQEGCDDLASQPTLSRFENRVPRKTCAGFPTGCSSCTSRSIPAPERLSCWKWTPPDDPTHGKQELSFFYSYYEEHMYHPLFVFDGHSSFPLAAVLRPGNTRAFHRALAVLNWLIKKFKKAYLGA